jgi:hypothetical protein
MRSVVYVQWSETLSFVIRAVCREFMEFVAEEGYPPSSMTLSPDMDSSDEAKNGGEPEMR